MFKKSFCETFSQAYLSSTNALVLLCGIGIAVLGTYSMFYPATFARGFFNISIALLVIGGIITIISFLAFCGVLMESRRITYAYIFVIIVVILAECGIIWYCISQQTKISKTARDIWNEYSDPIRDSIQNSNECCGYSSISEDSQCYRYKIPCKEKFDSIISGVYSLVTWTILGVTVFEILNLILALTLKKYYIKTVPTGQEMIVIDEELEEPERLEKDSLKITIAALDDSKMTMHSSY